MLSRTADHIYWLGRYVERAETLARALDVQYRLSLLPQPAESVAAGWMDTMDELGMLHDFRERFGEVDAERPRLFNVYAAGNFIEATPDTTYFQIGESKYGKPIIDRVIRRSSSLGDAVKCLLVSMDSTIRSNLSVGLPLDLVIVRRNEMRVARHVSIDPDNAYFRSISSGWSDALRHAFVQLPEHDWLAGR